LSPGKPTGRLAAALRKRLSKQNIERVRILREAASRLAGTYAPRPDAAYRPLSIAALRSGLQELGIERGDSILIHSAIGRLLRGGTEEAPPDFRVPTFAGAVIEMLMDLVSPDGSVVLPTAPPLGNYERAMLGVVFDPETDGVSTGLLPDLFRQRSDTIRTRFPCQNVTVWGGHASELVADQYEAAPYPMNEHSVWVKHCRMGGKVILLGVDHDRSSTVHLLENLHPHEYPRPVFYDKPHRFQYKDRGEIKAVDTYLHAVRWDDSDINSFCEHIGSRYGVYRSARIGRVPVTVFRSADQLEAFHAEMKQGVCLFDSRFWSRRR